MCIVSCSFPLLLAACLATVIGAPVETADSSSMTTEKSDCHSEHSDLYDQRQNGTENYRIHLNGVVVLVAPAETIFQASQMPHMDFEGSQLLQEAVDLKPQPRPPSPADKVTSEPSETTESAHHTHHKKDVKGNTMKFTNFLQMFRNMRHNSWAS